MRSVGGMKHGYYFHVKLFESIILGYNRSREKKIFVKFPTNIYFTSWLFPYSMLQDRTDCTSGDHMYWIAGFISRNSRMMISPIQIWPSCCFFTFVCRTQRGSDRNLPLGVWWVRHKNMSHPNPSTSATTLSTYASTESLGLSELNDTNIISFDVPERISRAVESTNFTTIVFTLPHTIAPKLVNQLPIRNVGRTCNCSGNV